MEKGWKQLVQAGVLALTDVRGLDVVRGFPIRAKLAEISPKRTTHWPVSLWARYLADLVSEGLETFSSPTAQNPEAVCERPR